VTREGREVVDGDVVPACVQSCPTNALVFGDLNDDSSQVSALSKSGRQYRILDQLGTEPAIYYLKKVDPNAITEEAHA
jgi:molybdopterin-containing oxidoreductase family iron-sulfur binding subunit